MAVRRLGGGAVLHPGSDCRADSGVVHEVALRWRGCRKRTVHALDHHSARRRRARGFGERRSEVHVVGHAPAEVLVKGPSVAEHRIHRRDARGIPRADVFVKIRIAIFAVRIVMISTKQIRLCPNESLFIPWRHDPKLPASTPREWLFFSNEG